MQETTNPSEAMEVIEKIVEEPKYTKKRRAAAAARKETPPAITAVAKSQKVNMMLHCKLSIMFAKKTNF